MYGSTGFKIKSITGFVWLSSFFFHPVQLQLKGETVRFESGTSAVPRILQSVSPDDETVNYSANLF